MIKSIQKRINQKGQGLVEYIVIIALITIATIVVVRLIGKQGGDTGVNAGKAISEQTRKAESQYQSDKGASDIGQLK